MKKNILKSQKAFTIIETLVAITILLIMLVGPLEIASRSLFSAFYARDEITAYYLAQEGIEYIRHARDDIFTNDNHDANLSRHWILDRGLFECERKDLAEANLYCQIDTTIPFTQDLDTSAPDAIRTCPIIDGNYSCEKLNYNKNTYTYNYDPLGPDVVPTKFTRSIAITFVSHDINDEYDEVLVESKVTWKSGSVFASSREFVLKEYLLKWQRD